MFMNTKIMLVGPLSFPSIKMTVDGKYNVWRKNFKYLIDVLCIYTCACFGSKFYFLVGDNRAF